MDKAKIAATLRRPYFSSCLFFSSHTHGFFPRHGRYADSEGSVGLEGIRAGVWVPCVSSQARNFDGWQSGWGRLNEQCGQGTRGGVDRASRHVLEIIPESAGLRRATMRGSGSGDNCCGFVRGYGGIGRQVQQQPRDLYSARNAGLRGWRDA